MPAKEVAAATTSSVEFARIEADGARVGTAPETEPWGERYCQFADPDGIVWQLVQWMN